MTTEERFTKIEHAIRDLIVVSRTFLESQKETTTQVQSLTEGHRELHDEFDRKMAEWAGRSAETEEKLHALVEIVDQIIRRKNDQS